MLKKFNIKKICLLLFSITLSMPILQIHRITLSLVLAICYLILSICSNKFKFSLNKFSFLLIIFLFLAISNIFICFCSGMGFNWKFVCIFNVFLMIVALYFGLFETNKIVEKYLDTFINGIKIGCVFNLIWCCLQLIFFYIFHLDINDFLFNHILGIIQVASAYRDGTTFCVTGLGWHPAQLVPIIVISYCFFDNIWVRIGLVGISYFSHNTTCLISCLLCFCLSAILQKKIKVTKKTILYIFGFFLFAFVILLMIPSVFLKVIGVIENTYQRFYTIVVLPEKADISSSLHARYYTLLPSVFNKMNLFQKLFGIGYECSGYPYTILTGQYSVLNDWITESDYINLLVGRGVIWFFLFYIMLIYIGKKGNKISYKYSLYILIILVCGILYNNQFWWVIILEFIMITSIKKGIDIWRLR